MVRYEEPPVALPRVLGWCVLLLGAALVAFGLWLAIPAYRATNSHGWVALAELIGGVLIAVVGAGFMFGSNALFRMKTVPPRRPS